jgi:hypothetical protein
MAVEVMAVEMAVEVMAAVKVSTPRWRRWGGR